MKTRSTVARHVVSAAICTVLALGATACGGGENGKAATQDTVTAPAASPSQGGGAAERRADEVKGERQGTNREAAGDTTGGKAAGEDEPSQQSATAREPAVKADKAAQKGGSKAHHDSGSPNAQAAQDQQVAGSQDGSEGAGLTPAEKVRKDEQQQK